MADIVIRVLTPACLALLLFAAPQLELPTGKPIELDAKIEKGEWDDARKLPSKSHEIYLKRTGPWLALGVVGRKAYDGEVTKLVVSEPGGAWQVAMILTFGQVSQPPALWLRGSLLSVRGILGDRRVPLQAPRAVLCRLRFEDGSWAAEYRIRLSALGVGRGDRRKFRIRINLSGDLLVFPEGTTERSPVADHAVLTSPDHWGESERWAPVTSEESAVFDDHEQLATLAMEQLGQADRETVDRLIISSVVRPRSVKRIQALRDLLEAGRRRNPTLPAWQYYLGRLLHEANLHEEAASFVESFPVPLRSSDAYLQLAVEHYVDTQRPDKALEIAKSNPRANGMQDAFHMATRLKSMLAEESKAKNADLPVVRFETAKGTFDVELFEDDARSAVLNFMDLVLRQKYFDGLRFGKVYGGFIAELGDPGTRKGAASDADGPPWGVKPEQSKRPPLRGRLVTIPLESGIQHGSRFVITLAPMTQGAGKAAVFGRVIKGLDVLYSLESDDLVKTVTVVRKREHSYDPKPARVQ
ncbi:MAG: peptidylprolyl isomerase [Planctomycetota bacterium]|jgi:cyclophilin family peptidyl-prolyl cis-trans isomerase